MGRDNSNNTNNRTAEQSSYLGETSRKVYESQRIYSEHCRGIHTSSLISTETISSSTSSDGFHISLLCLADIASRYGDAYRIASPFPHIVLDNLFDTHALRKCVDEFPHRDVAILPGWGEWFHYPNQYKKRHLNNEALMGPGCRSILHFMKSSVFVSFLEEITDISGILPDAHYYDGGLHQTPARGMLGVHTDFNLIPTMGLWRRVSILLYLNEEPGWYTSSEHIIECSDSDSTCESAPPTENPLYQGGDLELWNANITKTIASVPPLFNRLVIFTNSNISFHGHPRPLQAPSDVSRKSLVLYFYTTKSGYSVDPEPVITIFKPVPDNY